MEPPLSLFLRPTRVLDAIGKLFEKILLARIFREVSRRWLLRDEQFRIRHIHRISLQVAGFFERVSRYFGEKRLTGAGSSMWPRHSIGWWTAQQAHRPQLSLISGEYHLRSTCEAYIRSALPSCYFLSQRHAGWRGAGWINLPCPLQSVSQWHAYSFSPHRASSSNWVTKHGIHFLRAMTKIKFVIFFKYFCKEYIHIFLYLK